jgi:CRP-like cAMP-binding protein
MTTPLEQKILSQLRSAQLTSNMSDDHLSLLASIAQELDFTADEIIYEKGRIGQAIYLIESGQVVIETHIPDQGRLVLNTLGPGHFFGWSSIFPKEAKMAWTRSIEPTTVLAFSASALKEAMQEDPRFEYALMQRASIDMTARILDRRQQLADMLNK